MESSTELSVQERHMLADWAEPDLQQLRQVLPQELDQLAQDTKALVRQRRMKGALALLRLVLAYAMCDWSLRLVGAWASLQQIAEVSDVALLYRFRQCGTWLGVLVTRVLQQRNQYLSELGGVRLRLVDASVISQPGSQGTDWRIHASLDLGKMCLDGVELTDGHSGESLVRFEARADEIWVGDQGYAVAKGLGSALADLRRLLVRINWQNLRLYALTGERLDVLGWLKSLTRITERQVTLPTPSGDFELRLIACPLPAAEAEQARERVRKRAHKKGKNPNPNTLLAAGFVLLLTNLPADTWEASRILWVYRLRWQIELQFKRLKGLLHFDHLRAQDPRLAQTYLLAKILAALLMDTLVQQAEEQNPAMFQCLQRPVSRWRLDALLWQSLRDTLVGSLSVSKILAKFASLQRYLCDTPRARTQQLAWARRFLARLSGI
jgi:hypothetical protein